MEPLALPTQTKPPFPQSGRRHVRENRAIGTGLAAPIDRRKFPRAIGRRRDFARALSAILTLSERKTRAWNTARERPNQQQYQHQCGQRSDSHLSAAAGLARKGGGRG